MIVGEEHKAVDFSLIWHMSLSVSLIGKAIGKQSGLWVKVELFSIKGVGEVLMYSFLVLCVLFS
jgi:hypothetical protein